MKDNRFDSNKIIQPITFVDDDSWRQKSLDYIDKNVNGEDNFAITKLTNNGEFVRGNHLYYKMKDIEIYTELDNIIFVDLHNNSLYIKQFVKVEKSLEQKDPQYREYVLLLTDLGYEESDENFKFRWEAVTGRNQAYEALKVNLPVIDIDKSIVLVDNVTLKDSLTVREFISYLQNSNYVDPEEIDLNDFTGSEYI